MPLSAAAEESEPTPAASPSISSVIITEIQTGAKTAGDEFIELYNQTDQPVDITGWQLRISTISAPDSTSLLTDVAAVDDQPILLDGKTHFVLKLATAATEIIANQTYTTPLTKTDKTLALFAPNWQSCQLEAQDVVAWSAEANAEKTRGEGRPLAISESKDRLIVRYIDDAGEYLDTDDNLADFVLENVESGADELAVAVGATPGFINTDLAPQRVETEDFGAPSALASLPLGDCGVPGETPESPPSTNDPGNGDNDPGSGQEQEEAPPVIPAGNVGLKPPQLSELLPNPASPQADADDEYVELYNPNDQPFDLSNYILEAGLITKHRFVFTEATILAPRSFVAFFSVDTRLTLSNTSGQVRIIDPLGDVMVETDRYDSAKAGQAWLLANGVWQWTTKPTPNGINAISSPVVKTAKKPAPAAKKSTKSKKSTAKPQVLSTGAQQDVQQAAEVAATTRTPLHPGVLAAIAASALIYGAYEYRQDMANKVYQFRSNRAARRTLRQSVKGR